jgi:hypothetical protein
MHGFINVFAGACLAANHGLGEKQVAAILTDDQPETWTWQDNGLRWKDLAATTDQIAAARRTLALSFGSCSFDEPRADLRKLKWLK